MMQFETLIMPPREEWFPKSLAKQHELAATEVERLNGNRASFLESVKKAASQDIAEFDITSEIHCGPTRTLFFEQLQEELKLRRSMATLFVTIREHRPDASDQAHKAYEAAMGAVSERLVAAGYYRPGSPEALAAPHSAVIPGDVNRHPEVMAARNRYRDIHGRQNEMDAENHNLSAMQRLEETLKTLRERAFSARL